MKMKKVQVSLLVEESKQLIALGICEHPLLKNSLKDGRVVLKGGTTVSKISEILIDKKLRISGRITGRGTVSGLNEDKNPHTVLLENKLFRNIDNCINDEFLKLGKDDLFICSANAVDSNYNAAMMAGSGGGGNIGMALNAIYSEGVPVLIPVGIEKMIPGDIEDIIKKTGRKGKNLSWGMSVGLLPIKGEVITEIEAVKYLADVECQAIGAGGVGEASGSTTLDIWGSDSEVDKIINIIKPIKENKIELSGSSESLQECSSGCVSCGRHIGCGYKSGELVPTDESKIGVITIGQSPRVDLVPEIQKVLGDGVRIFEAGALDDFTLDEVNEKFKPEIEDAVLVTRMRDGSQVKIAEKYILELLQKCINKLEKRGIQTILLACTGKFPHFESHGILIKPQKVLQPLVSKLMEGEKVGAIVPSSDQFEQMKKWWGENGVEVELEAASPYGDIENIKRAASNLKKKNVKLIFMDCIGYTMEMKEKVKSITGKSVILPRTLISRIIAEIL